MKTCTIEGCGSTTKARGLCNTHYVAAHRAKKLTALPRLISLPGEGWRSYTVRLPADLREALQAEAREQSVDDSEIVRLALKAYIGAMRRRRGKATA